MSEVPEELRKKYADIEDPYFDDGEDDISGELILENVAEDKTEFPLEFVLMVIGITVLSITVLGVGWYGTKS